MPNDDKQKFLETVKLEEIKKKKTNQTKKFQTEMVTDKRDALTSTLFMNRLLCEYPYM